MLVNGGPGSKLGIGCPHPREHYTNPLFVVPVRKVHPVAHPPE